MFWLYYAGACAGAIFYLTLAERVRHDPEADRLMKSTRATFQIAHAILSFLVLVAAFSLVAPPFLVMPQCWLALTLVIAAFALSRVAAEAIIPRMRVDLTAFYIGAGPQIAILVLAVGLLVWRTTAVTNG